MSGHHRGDDLEDDYVPDDLVASSGEDEDTLDPHVLTSNDVGGLLSADEDAEQESAALAKRKRREREKERMAKKRKLAETQDDEEPRSVAAQPPRELFGYLSSMQAKAYPAKSALELLDISIPETSIVDTTLWTESRSLDHLVEFIIKGTFSNSLPPLHKRLLQRPKASGSPTLLFIAGAALRVADITRVLKDRKLRGEKGGDVAKLFARHIKLEQHATYLRRTKIGSAAGTPARVGKLLYEEGKSYQYIPSVLCSKFLDALSVAQLTHVILDVSYQDAKKRNLFDIPETRDEVIRSVLGAPKLLQGIQQGRIQVVLF
ncbi:U3-containing 90S pre-ribosomal complex subunit-domain containing protein [Pisolithus marmoratus]|nr:U3-containing 90S pre-ribosomal complex subunit-domain containing protein [Pisolithus marmoratus]